MQSIRQGITLWSSGTILSSRPHLYVKAQEMSVRRDYGTFSNAAARLLKPMVAPLGYSQIKGAAFGRQRDGWIEGFFLQQSAWGGGDFYVNIEKPSQRTDRLV